MTDDQTQGQGPAGEPSQEELRAQLEAELKKLRVEDVLVQAIVSTVNLAGRKAGLAEGSEDERDMDQLRIAIDAVAALLGVLERTEVAPSLAPVKDALSQLQMVFARNTQGQPAGGTPGEPPAQPEPPKPGASGRLWVPGQ